MDLAHERPVLSIWRSWPLACLVDVAQRGDDGGGALVFRAHHPIGDETEADAAARIGKTDLPPCPVMAKTLVVKIATGFGIELESIAPARKGRIATKDRDTLALRPRRLRNDSRFEQCDAARGHHGRRPDRRQRLGRGD